MSPRRSKRKKKADVDHPISSNLNDLIIDTLDIGMFVLDEDLNIIMWNQFIESYTGRKRTNMLGKKFFNCFKHLQQTGWIKSFMKAFENGTVLKIYNAPAMLLPDIGGGKGGFYQNVKLYPFKAKDGVVRGVLCLVEDLTNNSFSEERLQDILEHANDAIFMMDPDGRFTYVNQKTLRATGFGKEEMIGRYFMDFLATKSLDGMASAFSDLLDGEEVRGLDCIFVDHSGSTLRLEINAVPILSKDRTDILGIQGIARDITAHFKKDDEMRQIKELGETLLDTIPSGVAMMDRHLTLQSVNKAFCTIFLTAEAEAVGRSLVDYLPPKLFRGEKPEEWILEVLDKVRAGLNYEIKGIDHKTSLREWKLDIALIPIPGTEGKTILLIDDVTEREKVEEQRSEKIRLEAELEKLKGIDELKSEFISIASHELRTPLTGIWIYLERLIEGKYCDVSDKHMKKIESVMTQVSLLAKIVDEMLETSRLEAKLEDIELIPTSIEAIVALSISKLSYLIEKKGQIIEQHFPKDLPLVQMDPDKIERVVTNLLSNAINYSPSNSKIQILAEADDVNLKVMIVDKGPGISDEHKERIFDRFYVIDKSMTRSVGGVGLGLSIAKGIISNHDGMIWVEDGKNQGAVFIFTLPIRSKHIKDSTD